MLQDYLVLAALQHLQLLRCRDVDSFLQGPSQKCTGLQSFAIENCEDVRNINTINDFLRSTALRRLVLRNKSRDSDDAQGLVSFDTLASLAPTLDCLVLDNSSPRHIGNGPEPRLNSSTDLEGVCKSLQNLQQLCILCPTIDRKQWISGGLLTFLVSIHAPDKHIPHTLNKPTGPSASLAQSSSPEAYVS